MEIKAGRIFKITYCLALIGIILTGVIASSGWIGLAFGGGLFRAGLIIPDILILLIGCRIVIVAFNPTALDIYSHGRFAKVARSIGVFLIYVGVLAMIGMFFVKPITLLIFNSAGDGGVGYFVVGIYLILIACLAIPGIICFEITRLVGTQSRQKLVSTDAAADISAPDNQTRGYPRGLRRALVLTFLCWLALNAAAPYYFHHQVEVSNLRARNFASQLDKSMHDRSIPSQNVMLEVLDKNIIRPMRIINNNSSNEASDWAKVSLDKEGFALCQALLKQKASGGNWMYFIQDATEQKKAMYSGGQICRPDAIWFKDYSLDSGRTALSKYTPAGNLVYRLSFENPDAAEAGHKPGYIMQPTFKEDNGYLYFEWWNSDYKGSEVFVSRIMKVRVKEPAPDESGIAIDKP